jgi:hypothetical protein
LQIEYGVFSVSGSAIDIVGHYIFNQRERHKVTNFKEEIEQYVQEYDLLNYDPKYSRE